MRSITKRFTTNLWLAALLPLALAGCAQRLGTSGPHLTPPSSSPSPSPRDSAFKGEGQQPTTPAHARTVRFWRDYSKSVNEESLAGIADEVTAALMRRKDQIVGVEVVRFANGTNSIWAEMPVQFIWGPAPEIGEFRPDMDKAPTSAKLFKDAMKNYVEGERRKYEQQKADRLSRHESHVEEQLRRFARHLLEPPSAGAPCTRFATLAERMRAENLSHSVLITDGWADCPGESNRVAGGVALNGKHVIMQLTRGADSQADDAEFLRRTAFLHKLFPGSEVVPASMPDQAIEFIFR